jgi:hypothetical protein
MIWWNGESLLSGGNAPFQTYQQRRFLLKLLLLAYVILTSISKKDLWI